MGRKLWKALLASAVIGFVEAAGLDANRPARKRPLRIVWIDDRSPDDALASTGVWFLDPLGDPRPAPGDLRRRPGRALRVAPLDARRLARHFRGFLSALAGALVLTGCATTTTLPEIAPSLAVDPATMDRAPSGLYIRTDRAGAGLAAGAGDTVVVHYTGWLTDGTEIDSSRGSRPLVAELGPGSRLVAGWDEGIRGMRPGGRRTLLIPPELGYGSRGAGGVVPSGAWLVFEVELLEIR